MISMQVKEITSGMNVVLELVVFALNPSSITTLVKEEFEKKKNH